MANVYIVLSTYNGGIYLRPLIESIRRQSFADWTLVVRDDGSGDETVRLLHEAVAEDRRIVFLEDQQRLGASASFGSLMQSAYDMGAEYVLPADQDDVWHDDKLQRLLDRMHVGEASFGPRLPHLAYSDLTVVDSQMQMVHPSFLRHARLRRGEGRPLRILLGRCFVLGCACIINRPLLELALPMPKTVASHDWWVALCAAAVGHISYLPESTLWYRRHGKNTSGPAGFWAGFNPLRHSWAKRWEVGWRSFEQSLDQAEALRERLRERCSGDAVEALDSLDRFCGVFERPARACERRGTGTSPDSNATRSVRVGTEPVPLFSQALCGWRRVCALHRMGVPAIDLPRRLLYDLCVFRLPRDYSIKSCSTAQQFSE